MLSFTLQLFYLFFLVVLLLYYTHPQQLKAKKVNNAHCLHLVLPHPEHFTDGKTKALLK